MLSYVILSFKRCSETCATVARPLRRGSSATRSSWTRRLDVPVRRVGWTFQLDACQLDAYQCKTLTSLCYATSFHILLLAQCYLETSQTSRKQKHYLRPVTLRFSAGRRDGITMFPRCKIIN